MSPPIPKAPSLHLYAQDFYHGDAYVVGTREGLTALRDALTKAIDSNKPASTIAFPADGEGHVILVVPLSEERFNETILPYAELKSQVGVAGYETLPDDGTYYRLIRPDLHEPKG